MNDYQGKIKQLPLFPKAAALTNQLNHAEQEKFIEGILLEQPLELSRFIDEQDNFWSKLAFLNSPAQAGMNWLIQLDAAVLQRYTDKIEELYRLTHNFKIDEGLQHLREKIQSLVAKSGKGLRFEFIEQQLNAFESANLETLKHQLLLAKIYEKNPSAQSQHVKKWYQRATNSEDHDLNDVNDALQFALSTYYYPAVTLYLFRKKRPYSALRSLLKTDKHLLKKESHSQSYTTFEIALLPYIKSYICSALYQALNDQPPREYVPFIGLLSEFSSQGFRELFQTVLHDLPKDIATPLNQALINPRAAYSTMNMNKYRQKNSLSELEKENDI